MEFQQGMFEREIIDPQISQLNDDISQLRNIAGAMENKLQQIWSEKIKQGQIDKLNRKTEQNVRLSIFYFQLFLQLMQQLKDENQDLQNKMKEQFNENQIIVDSLKKSIQNQTKNFSYESDRVQAENQQLKTQFILVRAENDRLVKCMFDKIQSFQQKMKDIKMVYSNLASDTQEQLEQISQKYRDDALNMQKTISDFQQKLSVQKQTIEENQKEITSLKNQLQQQKEFTADYEELEDKYENLLQQHDKLIYDFQNSNKLQNEFKEVNNQRAAVETDLFKLKNKLIESEEYISSLKSDNQKLHDQNLQRLREIENLKNRMLVSGENDMSENMKINLERLQIENLENKEQILKITAEKNKLESIRKQLQLELQQKTYDIERSSQLLKSNKDQTDKLFEQNEDMRKEISTLKRSSVIQNSSYPRDLQLENPEIKQKMDDLSSRLNINAEKLSFKTQQQQDKTNNYRFDS